MLFCCFVVLLFCCFVVLLNLNYIHIHHEDVFLVGVMGGNGDIACMFDVFGFCILFLFCFCFCVC